MVSIPIVVFQSHMCGVSKPTTPGRQAAAEVFCVLCGGDNNSSGRQHRNNGGDFRRSWDAGVDVDIDASIFANPDHSVQHKERIDRPCREADSGRGQQQRDHAAASCACGSEQLTVHQTEEPLSFRGSSW